MSSSAGLPGAPGVRGTAGALGHSMEASFLANLGLAITSLEQGRLFGPLAPEEPIETRGGGWRREECLSPAGAIIAARALAMIERIA